MQVENVSITPANKLRATLACLLICLYIANNYRFLLEVKKKIKKTKHAE